jgi:hypothetical protein
MGGMMERRAGGGSWTLEARRRMNAESEEGEGEDEILKKPHLTMPSQVC